MSQFIAVAHNHNVE